MAHQQTKPNQKNMNQKCQLNQTKIILDFSNPLALFFKNFDENLNSNLLPKTPSEGGSFLIMVAKHEI